MTYRLRPPQLDELADLSALCLRSKAYWGYDEAFMAACVDELSLTPQDIATDPIMVLVDDKGAAGVAHVSLDDGACYLDKLFIDTDRLGLGYGRHLFAWACRAARDLGAAELVVEADPDAAAFYEKMGCQRAGEAASGSVAGRTLPRFVLPL